MKRSVSVLIAALLLAALVVDAAKEVTKLQIGVKVSLSLPRSLKGYWKCLLSYYRSPGWHICCSISQRTARQKRPMAIKSACTTKAGLQTALFSTAAISVGIQSRSGLGQGQVIKGWDQGIAGMWYVVALLVVLRPLSMGSFLNF